MEKKVLKLVAVMVLGLLTVVISGLFPVSRNG